jgi:transcriptional regulator with XRE-family HTH domain
MDDEAIRRGRFAVRLAELRSDSGLSFDALGVEIGVAGETIRRWEQGAYAPRSKATVSKLEQALDARTGELWALLKGYEIPTATGRHQPSAGTDPRVLAHLAQEVEELREIVSSLRSEVERRRRPRDGGHGSHLADDRVPAAS